MNDSLERNLINGQSTTGILMGKNGDYYHYKFGLKYIVDSAKDIYIHVHNTNTSYTIGTTSDLFSPMNYEIFGLL